MIFEFYWTWYEEYTPRLFENSRKSEKAFKKDCIKAMRESFKDYEKTLGEYGWGSISDWIKFACKKLESYGYVPVSPISFGYFGGYIIEERDKKEPFFKNFPKECQKLVKYNNRIRKRGDRELRKRIREDQKNCKQHEIEEMIPSSNGWRCKLCMKKFAKKPRFKKQK